MLLACEEVGCLLLAQMLCLERSIASVPVGTLASIRRVSGLEQLR
jgi:hypothetical protein